MKLSNRIFNNPNAGLYNHRPKVVVLDSSSTTLPTSLLIDGVLLQDDDRVLFTNLSDASQNNKVYKVHKTSLKVEIDGLGRGGDPHPGDVIYVLQGTHAGELWGFEGAWEILDVDIFAGGDVNSASNVGGGNGIFKQKVEDTLEFKTLVAGTNMSVTPVGDTLVLASTTDVSGHTAAVDPHTQYQKESEKDQPNGYAGLDSGGKVSPNVLPASVMAFNDFWNASTNSPSLADGVGNPGDVYQVNVAGSQNLGSGVQSFDNGDWVVYTGSGIWIKSINSSAAIPDASVSVAGKVNTVAQSFAGVKTFTDGVESKTHSRAAKFLSDSTVYNLTGDFSTSSTTITNVSGTLPSIVDQANYIYGIKVAGYTDLTSVLFTSPTILTMDSGDFAKQNGTSIPFTLVAVNYITSDNQTDNTSTLYLKSGDSTSGQSGDIVLVNGDTVETSSTATLQGIIYTSYAANGFVGSIANELSIQNIIDASLVPQSSGTVAGGSIYLILSGTTGDFSNVGGLVNPAVGTLFRATSNATPTSYGDYSIQRLIIAGTGIQLLNRITNSITRDQLVTAVNLALDFTHNAWTAVSGGGANVIQTAGMVECSGAKEIGKILLGDDTPSNTSRLTIGAKQIRLTGDTGNSASIRTAFARGSSSSSTLFLMSGDAIGTGNTGALNIRSSDVTGSGASGLVTLRTGVVRGSLASGQLNLATGAPQALSTANSGSASFVTGVINGNGAGNSGALTLGSGNLVGTGTGSSGVVTITTGTKAASSTGNTGAFSFNTGNNSGAGTSGSVTLGSGTTVSSTSGNVTIQTGSNSSVGGTGTLNLTGGSYTGTGASLAGAINITGGAITQAAATSSTAGQITIVTGNNNATNATSNSGILSLRTGTANGGTSGQANLQSGNSANASGSVNVSTGTSGGAAQTGQLNLTTGSPTSTGNSGGIFAVSGGTSGGGNSGFASLASGNVANGGSGNVNVYSGDHSGTTGSGTAQVLIKSGQINNALTGGTTGNLTLYTGNVANAGSSANSGAINMTTGTVAGSGSRGSATLGANFISLNSDTGISLNVSGSGVVGMNKSLFMTTGAGIQFFNNANTFQTTLRAHPTATNGITLNLPQTAGAASQALCNDGSGNLVFEEKNTIYHDFPNINGTPINLSNTSKRIQNCGGGSSDTDMILPDITTIETYGTFKVVNKSIYNITVKNFGGTTVYVVPTNTIAEFTKVNPINWNGHAYAITAVFNV